jgi:hypothetical protein
MYVKVYQSEEGSLLRRKYARSYILSLIVDIMDQNHCQLPWNGTQGSFAEPLKQKIIGVKEHGHGVHLFSAIYRYRLEKG